MNQARKSRILQKLAQSMQPAPSTPAPTPPYIDAYKGLLQRLGADVNPPTARPKTITSEPPKGMSTYTKTMTGYPASGRALPQYPRAVPPPMTQEMPYRPSAGAAPENFRSTPSSYSPLSGLVRKSGL